MHGQHPLPVGERELVERMDDLNAGVADQDVDTAIRVDRDGHRAFDFGLGGHIDLDAHRDAASALDLGGGVLGRCGREVSDHHLRSLAREPAGDLAADAAASAGNDSDLNSATAARGVSSSGWAR